MKKCYYAHCQAIYGTPQEERDIELLEELGYQVVNPSSEQMSRNLAIWRITNDHPDNVMPFFEEQVRMCDLVAFRGLPYTFWISLGVAKEIQIALENDLPVIELPTALHNRLENLSDLHQTCKVCGRRDKFNFHVSDEIWEAVVPPIFKTRVVCLACFDDFAFKKGIEYADSLEVPCFAGDKAAFLFEVVSRANVVDY